MAHTLHLDSRASEAISRFNLSQRLYIFLLFLSGAIYPQSYTLAQVQAVQAKSIAFWTPRTADLDSPTGIDGEKLRFLLEHALTKNYTVAKGDSLDHIIRDQYFLSISGQPIAYRIYLATILEKNPTLTTKSVLSEGQKIVIPVGPKYGALKLSTGVLAGWQFAAEHYEASGSKWDKLIREGTGAAETAAYLDHAEDALQTEKNLENNKVQARVRTVIGFKDPEHTGNELESQNIIPPVNSSLSVSPQDRAQHDELINTETVPLASSPESSILVGALPIFLPASLDLGVEIQCGAACNTCRSLLHNHLLSSDSAVRVVIADSGLDPAVVPNKTLLFPAAGKPIDSASNKHGTFVYSEMSDDASLGVLSDSQILVTSVVDTPLTSDGSLEWDLRAFPEVIKAVTESREIQGGASPLPTWIVNISASGEAPPHTPSPPFLGGGATGNQSGLLFVAAAGNNQGDDEFLTNILFAMENNLSLLIVGAVDQNGHLAAYSNHGTSRVDILAQGSCVCGFGSIVTGGTVKPGPAQISGTSQAAPVVTAAAALLASKHPRWNAADVKMRLVSTGKLDLDLVDDAVGGLLNIDDALTSGFQISVCEAQAHCAVHQADGFSFGNPPIWKDALDPTVGNRTILRLHAINCSKSGETCFRIIDKNERVWEEALPSNDVVVYRESGEIHNVMLRDITDIVLPVYQVRDPAGYLTEPEE